jgi:hypothetical protein
MISQLPGKWRCDAIEVNKSEWRSRSQLCVRGRAEAYLRRSSALAETVGAGGSLGVSRKIDRCRTPLKLKIRSVIETRVHVDHISGVRKLAKHARAKCVLHASAGARYEFFGVNEELKIR